MDKNVKQSFWEEVLDVKRNIVGVYDHYKKGEFKETHFFYIREGGILIEPTLDGFVKQIIGPDFNEFDPSHQEPWDNYHKQTIRNQPPQDLLLFRGLSPEELNEFLIKLSLYDPKKTDKK